MRASERLEKTAKRGKRCENKAQQKRTKNRERVGHAAEIMQADIDPTHAGAEKSKPECEADNGRSEFSWVALPEND